jgi:hypothetical protein
LIFVIAETSTVCLNKQITPPWIEPPPKAL